jgi:2-(1,2-epoxy-1,2-dihydrophenyl)acetyl-CoA isomerase
MPDATQKSVAEALVLEEHDGAVLTLRLNRPERLNALNVELGRALVEGLNRAAADGSARVIILTGAGRGFCAGGDLAVLRDARSRNAGHELEGLLRAGKEIAMAICTMPQPVIAAVNGPAAGAGMNLALACDLRIASEQATFGETFTRVGLFPDFGGTYFLPRIVGAAKAAELFYTAEMISATEAERLGIVNRWCQKQGSRRKQKSLRREWLRVLRWRFEPLSTFYSRLNARSWSTRWMRKSSGR